MNKKNPLRTIKYFTIFTSKGSKDSKDIKDIKVFFPRLSDIDIPL